MHENVEHVTRKRLEFDYTAAFKKDSEKVDSQGICDLKLPANLPCYKLSNIQSDFQRLEF